MLPRYDNRRNPDVKTLEKSLCHYSKYLVHEFPEPNKNIKFLCTKYLDKIIKGVIRAHVGSKVIGLYTLYNFRDYALYNMHKVIDEWYGSTRRIEINSENMKENRKRYELEFFTGLSNIILLKNIFNYQIITNCRIDIDGNTSCKDELEFMVLECMKGETSEVGYIETVVKFNKKMLDRPVIEFLENAQCELSDEKVLEKYRKNLTMLNLYSASLLLDIEIYENFLFQRYYLLMVLNYLKNKNIAEKLEKDFLKISDHYYYEVMVHNVTNFIETAIILTDIIKDSKK